MGIEPTYRIWKTRALPLSYTRIGAPRLELGIARSQSVNVNHYTMPRILKYNFLFSFSQLSSHATRDEDGEERFIFLRLVDMIY